MKLFALALALVAIQLSAQTFEEPITVVAPGVEQTCDQCKRFEDAVIYTQSIDNDDAEETKEEATVALCPCEGPKKLA